VEWDRHTPYDYDRNWIYLSRSEIEKLYEDKDVSKSLSNCSSVDKRNGAANRLRDLYVDSSETGTWPHPHVLTVVGYNWTEDVRHISIGIFDDDVTKFDVLIDSGERQAESDRLLVLPAIWRTEDGLKADWIGHRGGSLTSGAERRVPVLSAANVDLGSEEKPARLAVHFCPGDEIKAVVESEPTVSGVSPCSLPQ